MTVVVPWQNHADRSSARAPLGARAAGPALLPRWPLAVLLYGFPFIWVLGLAQFVPTLLSLTMIGYLVIRRRVRFAPGLWAWLFLVIWVVGCTFMLEKPTDVIAWGLRFTVIFNAGVFALYYINARATISIDFVLRGISVLWLTTVILGNISQLVPDLRLTTPMSLIMPSGLTSNDLVKDYVSPKMTETQQPWGAPTAYIRPAAPFPYANSWGLAFALTTPVVLARMSRSRSTALRLFYCVMLLASAVPAVASSNRGMLVGLALSVAFVIARLALRGDVRATAWGVIGFVVAASGLVFSGALGRILGRQEYSDSTGGRSSLYAATFRWVRESPIFGYGTTRMEPSIGVSMGTQGYFWTLLFCFGFVGLGIFLWFVLSTILRNWSPRTTAGLWLLSVFPVILFVMVFYSFDTMQLAVVLLLFAMLTRAKKDGEVL